MRTESDLSQSQAYPAQRASTLRSAGGEEEAAIGGREAQIDLVRRSEARRWDRPCISWPQPLVVRRSDRKFRAEARAVLAVGESGSEQICQ